MRLPDQVLVRNTPREHRLLQIIEALDSQLFAAGLQLTLETDFHELRRTSDSLDKLPLTPNFDPEKSDVGPQTGFWIKGVDFTGRVVMTQAARYYDCRDTTLALLHESLFAFYGNPADHAEAGEACRCPAPATHLISGRVCYHGELWIDRSLRGRGISGMLSRLLMALVLLRWRPDYLFAMVQPGVCTRGVAARYGYRNMQPHGMIWEVPSIGTLDEWVIWNSTEDLERTVMQP